MAILIDKKTKVLIQGITGTEGARACREMLMYGTAVVAGVTPGKGGQLVEGVPVYNSVREALEKHAVSVSLIIVPPAFVKDAALEAMQAGVRFVNILTEYVPAWDSSIIVAYAKKTRTRIIGPSSIGVISPGKGKLGSIGSGEIKDVFTPGPVGIISKSGGMTAELAVVLTRAGWGQSTAIGMGGDIIAGSDYADLLALFAKDKETKAIVMFGEVGGSYEEDAARFIQTKKFAKPVIAVVAGRFTALLKEGTVLGHAGAIVGGGTGGYESKVRALEDAGVHIARTIEQIPDLLRGVLSVKMTMRKGKSIYEMEH